jgi:putative ABC transport system substrate-binding protein
VSGARRRLVLASLACAVPGALAQPAARVRTLGLLTPGTRGASFLVPFLARHGWVEGSNLRIEVRRVRPDGSDVNEGVAALLRASPDVVVASGAAFVLPLARATRTIPIVCAGISDPVTTGLALSLQRPGMNVTGLSFGLPEAAVLQVGTLKALVPGLKRLVFVDAAVEGRDIAPEHVAAIRDAGLLAELEHVQDAPDVERVFALLNRPEAEAAWIGLLPRDAPAAAVARLAIAKRIATHSLGDEGVRSGMLMSYWIAHSDQWARVAVILDKVLRGANPANIPFELPDKSEFVLNRATARALGLRIPPEILVRATEVVG